MSNHVLNIDEIASINNKYWKICLSKRPSNNAEGTKIY